MPRLPKRIRGKPWPKRQKAGCSSAAECQSGRKIEGYTWGINTIEGQDQFRGHTFKIFFKNENHIAWLDDKPHVTSPDTIEVVHRDSGEPITKTDIKEGDVVSVLGLRGRDPFRTPKGLEILGPKHFGYEISYVPIERIMKEGSQVDS